MAVNAGGGGRVAADARVVLGRGGATATSCGAAPLEGGAFAASLRSLAALIRGGLDLRSAVLAWPPAAPGRARGFAEAAARRVGLGVAPPDALAALGPAAGPVAAMLAAYIGGQGGDVAAALDAHADALERRLEAGRRAAAAAAGARLSARLVASLPLVFVPFAPRPAAGGDGLTILLLVSGATLSCLGLWWIERLLPGVEIVDDPAVDAAELLAGLLRGGASLDAAVRAVAEIGPAGLARARRVADLGAPWPEALAADPALAWLAAIVRRAQEWGVPVADAISGEVSRRRAATEDALTAAVNRAAVLMALPLALCMLPAYLLLGVVPFLSA